MPGAKACSSRIGTGCLTLRLCRFFGLLFTVSHVLPHHMVDCVILECALFDKNQLFAVVRSRSVIHTNCDDDKTNCVNAS